MTTPTIQPATVAADCLREFSVPESPPDTVPRAASAPTAGMQLCE